MADLDDFFAKKDKKKKTKKGFSKANTEVLAKNLEENDRKEQQAEEKANDVNRVQRLTENAPEVCSSAIVPILFSYFWRFIYRSTETNGKSMKKTSWITLI